MMSGELPSKDMTGARRVQLPRFGILRSLEGKSMMRDMIIGVVTVV